MNIYDLHNRLIKRASAVEEKLNEEDKKKKPNKKEKLDKNLLLRQALFGAKLGLGTGLGGIGGVVLGDKLGKFLYHNNLVSGADRHLVMLPTMFLGSLLGGNLALNLPRLLKK